MSARVGSCLCGACRVEVAPPEKDGRVAVGACHCEMCRAFCSGPFFGVHVDGDVAFDGGDAIGVYASSDWADRGFCKTCGSALFWKMKDRSATVVALGLFKDQSGFVFDHEVFVEEQPDYYAFAGARIRLTKNDIMEAVAAGVDPIARARGAT